MNPNVIRESFYNHKGDKVLVKIYGIRNKNDTFTGTIQDIYPQLLIISTVDGVKSISYSDIISGDVVISYI